jgi:hypothetical protein
MLDTELVANLLTKIEGYIEQNNAFLETYADYDPGPNTHTDKEVSLEVAEQLFDVYEDFRQDLAEVLR